LNLGWILEDVSWPSVKEKKLKSIYFQLLACGQFYRRVCLLKMLGGHGLKYNKKIKGGGDVMLKFSQCTVACW
jgi:hypothetical protein